MPAPDSPTPSIRARVQESMADLSNAERKVARALLARYPGAGLTTVAALAQEAGVSAPTVLRFAARLGCSGFPELQRALVAELNALGSPLLQYEAKRGMGAGPGVLEKMGESFSSLLTASYAEVPPSEFAAVAALLADPSKQVLVVGGRFSGLLAEYLVLHLQLLRAGVQMLPPEGIARRGAVLATSHSTVLLVFDYRRYTETSRELAHEMHARGATVCLMTDNWLSPIAEFAAHVLPVHVDNASPFDSLVPATAVAESLVAGVTEILGDAGMDRVAQFEGQSELP
ncbi:MULTISPECIES: MurR/RpiR family transcriptional regulator [Brevibacterium]|uniref:MurR/RpiR family transcriptional regulator n=1 Tax=Brevibacterium salitolerans TaxID=1403566 RepID=A0ABP5ISH0_9MICO|nr:MurR/RpiR family transcriptional regulator [Brevibacterium sp.]